MQKNSVLLFFLVFAISTIQCVNEPDTNYVSVSGVVSMDQSVDFTFTERSLTVIELYYQESDTSEKNILHTEQLTGELSFPLTYQFQPEIDLVGLSRLPGELAVDVKITQGQESILLVDDLYGKRVVDPKQEQMDNITLFAVEECDGTNGDLCSEYTATTVSCGTLDYRLFVTEDYFETERFYDNYLSFEYFPRYWETDVPNHYEEVSISMFESTQWYTEPSILLEGCDSILHPTFSGYTLYTELPFTIPYGYLLGIVNIEPSLSESYTPSGDEELHISFYNLQNGSAGDSLYSKVITDLRKFPFSFGINRPDNIDKDSDLYIVAEIMSPNNSVIDGLKGEVVYTNPEDHPGIRFEIDLE